MRAGDIEGEVKVVAAGGPLGKSAQSRRERRDGKTRGRFEVLKLTQQPVQFAQAPQITDWKQQTCLIQINSQRGASLVQMGNIKLTFGVDSSHIDRHCIAPHRTRSLLNLHIDRKMAVPGSV